MQIDHLLEIGHIHVSQLQEHVLLYSCKCDLLGKLDSRF